MNTVNADDDAGVGTALPGRRERVRAATEAEILTTARELLVTGGPELLTLREVGRRMGMTASALYRYVDGHAALLDRLTASFFDELVGELRAAVPAPVPAPAPVQTVWDDLMTASRAFRSWSVAHPHEFRLMFGHHGDLTTDCHLAHEAAERFGAVFVSLFVRALDGPLAEGDGTLFSPLPEPLGELFARGWIRLLGLVMVEVSGEYDHDYLRLDPEQVFEAEMSACAQAIVAAHRAADAVPGGH
ncbi:MAG: TetR/AcrR family transcriptional regulator [Kineosporiaceae bacterium]